MPRSRHLKYLIPDYVKAVTPHGAMLSKTMVKYIIMKTLYLQFLPLLYFVSMNEVHKNKNIIISGTIDKISVTEGTPLFSHVITCTTVLTFICKIF